MGAFASKDDFMSAIKSIVGDNNSDEAISFIENASDTYDELSKASAPTEDTVDWQKKYEENDAQWRQRYTERFFSNTTPPADDVTKTQPAETCGTQIKDLFTERS